MLLCVARLVMCARARDVRFCAPGDMGCFEFSRLFSLGLIGLCWLLPDARHGFNLFCIFPRVFWSI